MNKKEKFRRYHSEIYFPKNFPEMIIEFIETFSNDIDLTFHAAEQMYEDKRGQIPLPTKAELLDKDNIIVEFYERLDRIGRIQKAVFRIKHLNEKYDYTYVVARGGVIVTCWANSKTDNHRLIASLNEYYCPKSYKKLIKNKLLKRTKNFKRKDNY